MRKIPLVSGSKKGQTADKTAKSRKASGDVPNPCLIACDGVMSTSSTLALTGALEGALCVSVNCSFSEICCVPTVC